MTRWILVAALSLSSLLWLAACATDDDNPFPTQPSTAADEPVPGASAPPRDDPSAGWKW